MPRALSLTAALLAPAAPAARAQDVPRVGDPAPDFTVTSVTAVGPRRRSPERVLGEVGARFGAYSAERKMDDRSLVVIGPDCRIAYEARPFRQMAQDAYDESEQVIDTVAGGK
jgi:peroxiredoxin